ncbi:MAG: class II fructose-bisphosphate aldolase [Candidatus Bipolaricaulia bacterium]
MAFGDGGKLREAYQRAEAGGYAFMANNLAEANVLVGLLEAYAEARSDLLVQISPGAAKFAGAGDKRIGLRVLCGMVHTLAARYPISVFINLDHFTVGEAELIEEAIEERLVSSIMIDASKEDFDENVRLSRGVAEMAEGSGILIEAELGKIKGVEDEIASDEAFYTDPDEAVEFVRATGADLLAVSIGTQHGVSKGRDIELRIDLAERIRMKLQDAGHEVPLVLHGSSGVLPEQVREVIAHGVRKLNKDTHYQYVYGRAACEFYVEHAAEIVPPDGVEDDVVNLFPGGEWSPNKKVFDPRAVGKAVRDEIKGIALALIEQAGSGGHALVTEEEE